MTSPSQDRRSFEASPGQSAAPPGNRPEPHDAFDRAAVTDPVQAAVVHALRDVSDLPAPVAESAALAWRHTSGDRVTALADAAYVASHEVGQRRGVEAAVGHVINRVEATRANLGSAAGDPAVSSVLDAVEGAARARRNDSTSALYGSGQQHPTHRAHMAAMSAASATAGEPTHQSAGAIARAVWPEGWHDGWRESFWHVNGAINAAKEFLDEKLYTTVVGNQPAASWLEQVAEQARDIADEPGDPFPAAKPRPSAAEGDTPTTGQAQAAVSRLSFAAPASAAPRSSASDATNLRGAPPRPNAPRGKSR